jgi:hypothetical protein
MRSKKTLVESAGLALLLAATTLAAQETPQPEEAAGRLRARLGATPIGAELAVTLAGGERLSGTLAEVASDSFGLWIEPDEATRERLRVGSGKLKKWIRYDEVKELSGAREVPTSLEQLPFRLRIGDSIRLETAEGTEVEGRLEDFDGDRLRVGASSFRLSQGDVHRIDLKVNDSLANGSLIGLGVGVGWVGLGCAAGGCDAAAFVVGALILGGGGAGLGALFDALHTGSETVYVSTSARDEKSVSLVPLLGGDRKGLALSLRF